MLIMIWQYEVYLNDVLRGDLIKSEVRSVVLPDCLWGVRRRAGSVTVAVASVPDHPHPVLGGSPRQAYQD